MIPETSVLEMCEENRKMSKAKEKMIERLSEVLYAKHHAKLNNGEWSDFDVIAMKAAYVPMVEAIIDYLSGQIEWVEGEPSYSDIVSCVLITEGGYKNDMYYGWFGHIPKHLKYKNLKSYSSNGKLAYNIGGEGE